MQKMSSDDETVRDLLQVLTKKILECKEPLQSQDISDALFGLQNCNSDSKEVLELLVVLKKKITESSALLHGSHCGFVLFGLQKMNSKEKPVREIISILTKKISECQEVFDSNSLGNALFGLQSMNNDNQEVCDLSVVLLRKVKECSVELRPQTVSDALYGLQNMSSERKEVRELLQEIGDKVSSSKTTPSVAQNVSKVVPILAKYPHVKPTQSSFELVRKHEELEPLSSADSQALFPAPTSVGPKTTTTPTSLSQMQQRRIQVEKRMQELNDLKRY